MELNSISIQRYRSIEEANNISLSNYTVLIGCNNEGKTNIVSAIKLAFQYCNSFARNIEKIHYYQHYRYRYDFKTDYPVRLQNKNEEYLKNNPTIITLEFRFNSEEIIDFKKELKTSYKSSVKIRLSFYKDNCVTQVVNRKNDIEKNKRIISFITKRLKPTFIPTIRTSKQSMEIIEEIVHNNLDTLRNNEEYNMAYELIHRMEEERLREISKNLIPTLSNFIPNIKDIDISLGNGYDRNVFRRDLDLIIDDGVLTSIENKGDGIKSLIQMGLLKEMSSNSGGLIVVEEPESHLHSGAIHELNQVLRDISKNQQVLLTTHNAIFANGYDYNSNILVSNGKCQPIHDLEELRENLGIEVSDSLFATSCLILVEGKTDKKIFKHLLSSISPKFRELVENNKIGFYETKGSSKAKSFMVLLQQLLINYYCIWDRDVAGENAYKESKKTGLINEQNYVILPKKSTDEVEIEDIINKEITDKYVEKKYNITINNNIRKKNKWSDRIKANLQNNGKIFDSEEEERIKNEIANIVEEKDFDECINPAYKEFIQDLANNICNYFGFE